MILGSGTLIFYSVLGGIRAVIITDILQFSLFYVILPVLCTVFMRQTGGWTAVAALVPEDKWHFTWQTKDQMWMFYSGLLWMFLPLEGGPFIQRFLISMSNKQLTQALSIATILDCSIAVMVCLFGFVTIAATKGLIAPQDIVWYAIDSKLWGLLKGAFVVSVLALIMSTADFYLNNAGVLFARDLIKPIFYINKRLYRSDDCSYFYRSGWSHSNTYGYCYSTYPRFIMDSN